MTTYQTPQSFFLLIPCLPGELEYWGLSALHLEPCCAYTLQRASWLLPIVNHGIDTEDEVVSALWSYY